MYSSHSTGCERICEFRSRISAHFRSPCLKLRKVPTVPWHDPSARKTVSPLRNVSKRKMSGDWMGGKRCIFFRPFWQETSGTDDSAGRKTTGRSALGERCQFKYTALRTAQSDYSGKRNRHAHRRIHVTLETRQGRCSPTRWATLKFDSRMRIRAARRCSSHLNLLRRARSGTFAGLRFPPQSRDFFVTRLLRIAGQLGPSIASLCTRASER